MSVPLTQGLGAFVANSRGAIPPEVVSVLRRAFIDTVAALLAGRYEAVSVAALAFGRRRGGEQEATLLLGRVRMNVAEAAFVNAVAAHALDYDDMGLNGHPSVVLVPALLACAEATGATDGEVLSAYLTGYETWGELAAREPDKLHAKGWHPTGVFGTVAVAAAVAHLLRLDAVQSAHALGISASLAGGLMGNFGSMTKPLHAGWAARHGVEAAQLAQLGVSATSDVLESDGGFLAAFSPAGRAQRGPLQGPDGLRILSQGLSIKKYPVGFASHRAIDAAIDLRASHLLRASDIASVEVRTSEAAARMLHHHAPSTALKAKFSLEFACAMALADGTLGLAQVTDAQVQRPDIQALMRRITVTARPPADDEVGDQVIVELAGGVRLESEAVLHPRGHARRPMSDAELDAKFMGCVAGPEAQAAATLLASLKTVKADGRSTLCEAVQVFANAATTPSH